jgi:hypothetical protein
MDLELKETNIWGLYESHLIFMNRKGYFAKTDRNFRFFNGDQWEGVVLKKTEPIQVNFIKPIVKYKVGVVTSTDYALIYNSENYDNEEFRDIAKKASELVTKKAQKVWEINKMDTKLKKCVKKAAINGEAVTYFYWDNEKKIPLMELKSKVDIMFGNENDDNIQDQPYILLKKRTTLSQAREYAKSKGVNEEDIGSIHADNFTQNESGIDSKEEVNDMVTIVTMLYKKEGTIHYSEAMKFVDVEKDVDTGLTYYPIAHLNWEDCEGNARGIGEVEQYIDTQIEVNKTATRRAFIGKMISYPHTVINRNKIDNPQDINKVGSTIYINDGNAEDVSKFFKITTPGQISPDIASLQNELISTCRELAGAGDIATGQIKPDEASGKAILAVQRASEQPLDEQSSATKQFIEDMGLIIFDMLKTYSDSLIVVNENADPVNGDVSEEVLEIPKMVLEALQISIKIDVTPKSAYDKYAQEVSLENLAKSELFLPQNQQLLEDYVSLLDEFSTMPKAKLLELLKRRKKRTEAIEQMSMEAEQMKLQAQQNQANAMDIENMSQIGNQLVNETTEM